MDKQEDIIGILKTALQEIASNPPHEGRFADCDGDIFWSTCPTCEELIDTAQQALDKVRDLE